MAYNHFEQLEKKGSQAVEMVAVYSPKRTKGPAAGAICKVCTTQNAFNDHSNTIRKILLSMCTNSRDRGPGGISSEDLPS